jgi:large subunit ribosomal protein L9
MEVILFDNVKGLGRQGDKVKVSEGYFRNFLKPKNLAEEATPAALKRYNAMKKKAVEMAALKVAEARELEARIQDVVFTVPAKAGTGEKLFGAVTSADIAKAMEAQGFSADKKQIELPEPIKTLGEHKVHLKIHPEVTAEITIKVERAEK